MHTYLSHTTQPASRMTETEIRADRERAGESIQSTWTDDAESELRVSQSHAYKRQETARERKRKRNSLFFFALLLLYKALLLL